MPHGLGGDDAVDVEQRFSPGPSPGHAEEVGGVDLGAEIGRGLDLVGGERDDFLDAVDDEAICTFWSEGSFTWTTTMQVRSANSALRSNFTRRSTTGMTRPRRLITPFTKTGHLRHGCDFLHADDFATLRTAIP